MLPQDSTYDAYDVRICKSLTLIWKCHLMLCMYVIREPSGSFRQLILSIQKAHTARFVCKHNTKLALDTFLDIRTLGRNNIKKNIKCTSKFVCFKIYEVKRF